MTLDANTLKDFLARELGFAITSLDRLPGRSASINYKAVRGVDGLAFVVKALPRSSVARVARWKANLRALEGSKSVRECFADKELVFGDYRLIFLSYGVGKRLSPRQLTDRVVADLRADYAELARTMSACENPYPYLDGFRHYERLMSAQIGWRRKLADGIVRRRLAGRKSFASSCPLVVVHGDFHLGNLAFDQGRLSAVFDVEDLRYGSPAEDWVRLFSCAYEHLSPFRFLARRRLLKTFAELVRTSSVPEEAWLMAIDLYLMLKAAGFGCGTLGLRSLIKMIIKTRTYVMLRRVAREALHG